MSDIAQYVDAGLVRFVDELSTWVRVPSVSSDPRHAADVVRSAETLAESLRALDAPRIETWATPGHPAVFAEWTHAPGMATLLVYGHHDVQPPDPLGEWVSPPFEPTVREGRLWGRGTADDKGQVHVHAKAVEALMRTRGRLPINLKMIVEGEEEIGSPHLEQLWKEHARELAADVVCISDTSMFAPGIPSICVGLRGLTYIEVWVDGPAFDLHSGVFGGAVRNPILALASMLDELHDEDGRIRVPGFYDAVRPLSEAERSEIAALPFDEVTWLRSTGAPEVAGEKGYATLERLWARPTLDCCGIWGGFQGEGAKTVLPARAGAKISCRLVPDQEPDDIAAKLIAHLERIAPGGVRVRARPLHGGAPYRASADHPVYELARRALAKAFGREPVTVREGGSIPFVKTISDATGKPCVLMGFGQPDENAHAPNEWLDLENYRRGILAAAYFYCEMGKLAI